MSEKNKAQKDSAELYAQLSERFPEEMEHKLSKGGRSFTYNPVSEVINRLNKIVGVDKWSYTVLSCSRDNIDPDFIIAHVRMTITTEFNTNNLLPENSYLNERTATRDGFGGAKVKRTKAGEILDIGDDFKGAISDAVKKAAQAFGIGLYLARNDDAMEIEEAMEAVPANADAYPIWDNFIGISKKFTAEQKAELRSKWAEWSGGKAVPTKDTVTAAEAGFLHGEAVAISFSEKKKD